MKLSTFIQPDTNSLPQSPVDLALEGKELETVRRRKSSVSGVQSQKDVEKTITLTLHIEEYDVILVEKMDDVNCLALILNVIKTFVKSFKLLINFFFNRTKSQRKFEFSARSKSFREKSKISVCTSASSTLSDAIRQNITFSILVR